MQAPIRFGDFEVRPASREILQAGVPSPLGARAFDVLLALVEHRDRLVTKDELLARAWPGLVVEENNLAVQVSGLRKLFGPNVIATIPGRGYRWAAQLDEAANGTRVDAPARAPRHTLPAERDDFIGRDEALQELQHRFAAGARLVSLLGIGGTGKTRLATRYGATRTAYFPGGVWFCDLAPARSAEGVLNAVALGLDVPPGRDDPVAQLGDAIAGRGACLVILDNFEQVARHAEVTLGRWLERAPAARFLATTREVLGIVGEQVQAVAPLPPPEAEDLFLRRAAAAGRTFDAASDERAAVRPLVALLDGLPLAIELAAARVRTLAPRALLSRIGERFRLLSSTGGRTARQATLRAAFDWSWDLLRPAEKLAFAQCAVFEGGFTLEAAEAVIDLSPVEAAPWIVDVVQSLVEKSLLRCRDDRFDMLASIQDYAAEHLRSEDRFAGSGVAALRAAQQRHASWFARFGADRAVETLGVELHNLVVACQRSAAGGDVDSAVGALEGAWAALNLRGPFKAGADLAEAVSAMPGLQTASRVRTLAVLGDAQAACGQHAQALANYEAALAAAEGDAPRIAQLTGKLATTLDRSGRPDDAWAAHERALAMARALQDVDLACAALIGLGLIETDRGRTDAALALLEQALQVADGVRDRRLLGNVLGNLGNLHLAVGRLDAAAQRFEQALRIGRELHDRVHEGNSLCNLGWLQLLQGRHEEARRNLEGALEVARETGHARLECVVLCNLGMVHGTTGGLPQAIASYDAALNVARRIGDRRTEGQVLGYLGQAHARLHAIEQARACLERGEALLDELADRISLGVLLCARAECEFLAGDAGNARGALERAAAIAREAGVGSDSELAMAVAQVGDLVGGSGAGVANVG